MLKLVPNLKTNKSLKLLLVDKKVNGSMLMRLTMAGIPQNKENKEKCLIFVVIYWVRVDIQNLKTKPWISEKEN